MKTADILDIALGIIEFEICKLKFISDNASGSNVVLDRQQAGILTDYIKTLVVARKEERESAKADDLQAVSNDELDQLAIEATDYLTKTGTQDDTISNPVKK